MKISLLILSALIVLSSLSIASAQTTPTTGGAPPGAGDKNLAADDIKMRSLEIERMKREAKAKEAAAVAPISTKVTENFPAIKEDFEGIQLLGNKIIEAFNKGISANSGEIESAAREINEKAERLDSNLFDPAADSAEKVSNSKEAEKPASVREMIVKLDNSIGEFVASKLFQNLQVVEPEVAIKSRKDLSDIRIYSKMIADELRKSN